MSTILLSAFTPLLLNNLNDNSICVTFFECAKKAIERNTCEIEKYHPKVELSFRMKCTFRLEQDV